jgi:copper chaperone CopZ
VSAGRIATPRHEGLAEVPECKSNKGVSTVPPGRMKTTLVIMGMRDSGCRERIVEALEMIAGVNEVDVNLYRAQATIIYEQPCSPDQLVAVVCRVGYGASLLTGESISRSDQPARPDDRDPAERRQTG